ncbi:MAG: hypothetical protein EOM50_01980 [Erysipelotrichia bacterium]|nr:hypothetical protein [Erysipelotrichia bacterium]NCC55734.1 hypothetical protein [Erysipelotrichia bacterium]
MYIRTQRALAVGVSDHISLYTNHFDEAVKFYKEVFQCCPRGFFKMHGKNACMLYLNENTF